MANEEISEINDFSMASDWERFITDLEEILTEWNLIGSCNETSSTTKKDSLNQNVETINTFTLESFQSSSLWSCKQEQIKFGKVLFCLNYNYYKGNKTIQGENKKNKKFLNKFWEEMHSFDHDWVSSGHPLVRYYGLSQFLLLSPINQVTISTEDRAKHLIGSAAIALSNVNCEIPFFCQIGQLNRRLFVGVQHVSNGFRTYFDMIQFPKTPDSFQYLSDFETLFKKKLYNFFCYFPSNRGESRQSSNATPFSEMGRIQVSVRFTYLLNLWPPHYLLSTTESILNSIGITYFRDQQHFEAIELLLKPISLSDQKMSDPFKQLQLATTWPSIAEELIVDNANHSYLQPRNAPKWSLRALFNQFDQSMMQSGQVPTASFLFTLLNFQNDEKMLNHYLQKDSIKDDSLTNNDTFARMAFDRLTETGLPLAANSVTNLFSSSASKYITRLMQNLPTNLKAFEQNDMNLTSQIQSLVRMLFQTKLESKTLIQDNLNLNLKSAPIGSLCWRITLLIGNIYYLFPDPSSIASVWKEFIHELRRTWNECELIQFVNDDNETNGAAINYTNCLFNQKLQMLNCCILQKFKHEFQNNDIIDTKEDGDEEDEFFECNDEEETESIEATSEKAEGRLEVLKDSKGDTLYLLKRMNEPIYVPITQEMSPMTEDMLMNQMNTLSNLECNEDLNIRARFQSAGLISDMEAFKAANPGSEFEDFIRWHSPRDWVEIDNEKYGLSRRMQDSNSTWHELWSRAKAVPVHRQKRLFNYTKEAEQILQSFEMITVKQLIDLLAPVLVKSIILQLSHFRTEIINFVNENIGDGNRKQCENILNEFFFLDTQQLASTCLHSDFHDVCKQLALLEFKMLCFYSTLKKLIIAYECEFKNSFENLIKSKKETGQKTLNDNNSRTKPKAATLTGVVRTKTGNNITIEQFVLLVIKLLTESEVEFPSTNKWSNLIIRLFQEMEKFKYEESTSIGDRLGINVEPEEGENDDSNNRSRIPLSSFKVNLPAPSGKEFIFRANDIPRPTPYSRPSPHRMYCLLSPNNDFRVASAFVEDSVFF